MIDTKKSDDKIPDEIIKSQKKWLNKCNGYFGLLTGNPQSILVYCLSIVSACLIISTILVTTTNTIGYNENNLNNPVIESNCSCDCWDGFYRGQHSRKSNQTEYKFLYFNYKQETIKIFIVGLFYINLLVSLINKSLKHIFNQLITRKKSMRWSVLLILSLNVYSNFWFAWNLFNFLNDQDNRYLAEISIFITVELLIIFFYFKSLDRLSIRKGNYKPITMSTIAPIFCLNMFNFCTRLNYRLEEQFFKSFYSNFDKININECLFFLKEVFSFLFTYYALKKTNRPSYPVVSKGEMKGKGAFVYFSLWFAICLLFYTLRIIINNKLWYQEKFNL